ncbi:MAG: hypothetical protein C0500_02750 [Sphingobium sp.]|nr:hypothetical protein [Sphingobium sp.]
MNDTPTPSERAEAAAIRRRWITLGEIVAVAGLIISALALYLSYADRRADEAERQREKASEEKVRSVVLLNAAPADGGRKLALKDATHAVQSITVAFPSATGIGTQASSVTPEIDSRWFAAKLLALTDRGPDDATGRLPVLITADYWDGDTQRHDAAIYDIVWESHGRLIDGRALRLKGLMLHQRKGATQAAIDARWAAIGPRAPQ